MPCIAFEEPQDPASKSFFSEIIASTSDVQFSNNGRYFLSRDYLTIKVLYSILANIREFRIMS